MKVSRDINIAGCLLRDTICLYEAQASCSLTKITKQEINIDVFSYWGQKKNIQTGYNSL